MSHQVQFASPTANGLKVRHPLDPLSVAEREAVVSIVRAHPQFPIQARFMSIDLREPDKY
ncbi:hypothetical protein [Candidatus Entotheonella palauensis]|uniref:hypothetical protein n=1 Tax=Candidatus Entotheonella palauensis TaxID=93172 RepID=UPI0015C4632D|nr:hypothetical protein [Candidatus Entotheonella palauensis]